MATRKHEIGTLAEQDASIRPQFKLTENRLQAACKTKSGMLP
jgi:hypothetical protein